MNARAPVRVLLAVTIAWSLAVRAGAQTPPIQLGVDSSGLGLYRTPTQTGVYGAGVRVDVPLTRRVDVDGRLTWFPSNADAEQDQGGRTLHSAAVNEQAASAADPIFVRYNATALDVGGVFERYIRGHWLIRFDGGDVISVFRASQLNYHGVLLREPAPPAISSIQTTIGVGWRF